MIFHRTTKLTHSRDSAVTIREGLSEIKSHEIRDAHGCWVQRLVRRRKSQSLLLNMHVWLVNAKLLEQAATFETNDEAIAVTQPVNIAMPNVWMPESQPCRCLGRVTKKTPELSETEDGAWAKIETSRTPLSHNRDVKIRKTVIAVETIPLELRF